MTVAAPHHSSVRVSGLGRHFPASKVDICNTSSVVVGNGCALKTTDHYHAYRASLDLGPLLQPSAEVRKALRKLVRAPADGDAITALQRALRTAVPAQRPERRGQVEHRAASDADIEIRDCGVVQLGNGSVQKLKNRYTVEERIVPLADLLMESDDLVIALGRALGQPDAGTAASFARAVIKASGQADEFEQLSQLPLGKTPDTTLFSFWRATQIANGAVVMVGEHNRYVERLELDLPELGKRGLLGHLDELRQVHAIADLGLPRAPVPLERAPVTEVQPRRWFDGPAAPLEPDRRRPDPFPRWDGGLR